MNDRPPIESTRADELVIDNLETLKVIADQMRKRILEQFDKPSTVKEVAHMLGTSPSKLYYHVNLLEEHGLLVVTDTRIVSGIIEKQYQAAARTFRVKAGLLSPSPEDGNAGLEAMLSHFFDQTKEEARRSVRANVVQLGADAPPHLKLYMSTSLITLSREQAVEFYRRLGELAQEFEGTDEDQPYLIQMAMFPVDDSSVNDDRTNGGS